MQQQNNQKNFLNQKNFFKPLNSASGIWNSGGSHKSFWELFEPLDSDGKKANKMGNGKISYGK